MESREKLVGGRILKTLPIRELLVRALRSSGRVGRAQRKFLDQSEIRHAQLLPVRFIRSSADCGEPEMGLFSQGSLFDGFTSHMIANLSLHVRCWNSG